jgi:hypothetical protein
MMKLPAMPPSSFMQRLVASLLFCTSLFIPSAAKSGEFEDGFLTAWEVLWHPSGSPVMVSKWGDRVRYRYFGVNIERHRAQLEQILATTAKLTGVRFEDVSAQSDGAKTAQMHIEVVANNGDVPERWGCYVQPLEVVGFQIKQLQLRMRDRDTYGCMLHEMMHAMGISGHPSGDTVLTYFNGRGDKFLPFDEFLLKAWYSPKIPAGTLPFNALDELTQAWADTFGQTRPDADEVRHNFLNRVIKDMQKFAKGTGEPPLILIRSGTLSGVTVELAKRQMSLFLGNAYLLGTAVTKDPKEAEHWYNHGAAQGEPGSMLMLGFLFEQRAPLATSLERAYFWYTLAETYKHPAGAAARNRLVAKLSPLVTNRLDAEAAAFKPK